MELSQQAQQALEAFVAVVEAEQAAERAKREKLAKAAKVLADLAQNLTANPVTDQPTANDEATSRPASSVPVPKKGFWAGLLGR